MKICKFHIEIEMENIIQAPSGTIWLSAQLQHNQIVVWGIVNPDNASTNYKTYVLPTGAAISQMSAKFMGTVQLGSGSMILHIFIEDIME